MRFTHYALSASAALFLDLSAHAIKYDGDAKGESGLFATFCRGLIGSGVRSVVFEALQGVY